MLISVYKRGSSGNNDPRAVNYEGREMERPPPLSSYTHLYEQLSKSVFPFYSFSLLYYVQKNQTTKMSIYKPILFFITTM